MSRLEFIALCAMMFATVAFSIDAMLPALPQIGRELSPENLNHAQLIIISFVLGMGLGTFFTGPLSDAYGRKPVLIGGALLYTLCAFIAWRSRTLELLLVARLFQGIGAAGPRIVMQAIVRDLFSGREMARIVSFAMMIFTLVPAIAPALGQVIIDLSNWRGIFVAFMVFSLNSVLWLGLRLPEPLPQENRRPFRLKKMIEGMREMAAIPMVRLSILVQALIFALLFGTIATIQPIFDITFGRADSFPYWYAGVALFSGSASLLNARLVMRLGMRFLITAAAGALFVTSGLMALAVLTMPVETPLFYVFILWQTSIFFSIGMTLGNLNALAMEPLGHMAGTAASVMGAVATVLGAALGAPIGLAFDGTPLPLALAICALTLPAFLLMLRIRKLERPV